uniref:Uncharacterized protein n=1 Tax=Manihot esculenta TaxID=3983 RepID=A0A2C9UV76_MANES
MVSQWKLSIIYPQNLDLDGHRDIGGQFCFCQNELLTFHD